MLLLFASGEARANPWDLYGFNPRAMGMGSAHTAFADDFTAVYYNPAALTAATDGSFGFGLMLSRPSLAFTFDKAERPVQHQDPSSADGITFGAVFPLSGRNVKNRVALGLAINVPTSSLLNGQSLDPVIPHWYMHQSLPKRIVAALGIGAMPFEWLSLGLGVQILAGLEGSLDYELDVVAGRFSRKTVVFDIVPKAAPMAGIELRPMRNLRFGASYRASIATTVNLPVDLEVTGLAELQVATSFLVQYTPHQLSFGASYRFEEWDLAVSADVVYALWSGAPDPSVYSRIDIGGPLFEGTGLGEALAAPAPGQERAVDLAFRNIFIPRVGVEQGFGWLSVRGGYAIRPSPAPLQTSGTNYADSTAHIFSAGLGARFHDPLGALANPLIVDAGGAIHFHPTRRHEKIDSRDPVGSFETSGYVAVAGLSVRYEFGEAPVSSEVPALEIPVPGRRSLQPPGEPPDGPPGEEP